MYNPFRSLIRTSAFLRKEIVEIFRQPRLLVTLVLGPFLILLLFGIGYRGEGRQLRTVFVVKPGDPIEKQIADYAPKLGKPLEFDGVRHDLASAKQQLLAHRIDLIVEAPSDVYQTVRNNRQATFHLYHNEIDPYQAEYIRFTGELYVGKLNQWLLTSTAENKRGDIRTARMDLRELLTTAHQLRSAIDQKQVEVVQQRKKELIEKLNTMEERASSSVVSLPQGADQEKVRFTVAELHRMRQELESSPEATTENGNSTQIAQMEKDLWSLDARMNDVVRIDPQVLFSPFRTETSAMAKQQPKLQEYFTPSVIILLLQHLAITLASLSIVREFRTGSVELFRVSPLLKGELLLGKYLGYAIVNFFVAAVLTVLLVFALRMPMLGSWVEYSAVLVALILTSLGIGFLVSLISSTDNQAIQFSMILLLLSIFFTGFLLNLDLLWRPVHVISWLLPATYGIRLMQDIMLRGISVNLVMLGTLAASGVVIFVLSAILLSRKLAPG